MGLVDLVGLQSWTGDALVDVAYARRTSPSTEEPVSSWQLFTGFDPDPDYLVAGLSAAPNPATAGSTVRLSAAALGGVAPYSYAFTAPAGVSLSGAGATRTFTAPASATDLACTVTVTDSTPDTPLTATASVAVRVGSSTGGRVLYAGHIPGRVLLGFAAPEANRPDWSEARALIRSAAQAQLGAPGVGAYERRRFSSTATDGRAAHVDELRNMLADGDAAGVYMWVSFKVLNTDWAGVANGSYPAIPEMFRTVANERRAAGKPPFAATLHHEPRGDGPLTDWSAMHTYMSNQLADVSDICAWSCIGNGFLWNTMPGTSAAQADRAATFPQTLIDTFRRNRHVVAVDTYDDHPAYSGQQTYPVGGQTNRCSAKLANWVSWMRARNSGALGIGEWGVTDVAELRAVGAVFWANRDILGVANYFDSIGGGSTWDWRLIPASYPSYPVNPGTDYGGTALTEGRLNGFAQLLVDSVSPANTAPL